MGDIERQEDRYINILKTDFLAFTEIIANDCMYLCPQHFYRPPGD